MNKIFYILNLFKILTKTSRFYYSCRSGYVYLPLPKSGCSTIKMSLWQAESNLGMVAPYDRTINQSIHFSIRGPWLRKKPAHFPSPLFASTPYLFTFVRNPYSRILSAFNDKILRYYDEKRMDRLRLVYKAGLDPTKRPTYKQFLLSVQTKSHTEMDVHWRPQVAMMHPEIFNFDYVGYLEQFDACWAQVSRKLFNDQTEIGKYYEKGHSTGASSQIVEAYQDPEVVQLVNEIYGEDFKILGYGKDYRYLVPQAPIKDLKKVSDRLAKINLRNGRLYCGLRSLLSYVGIY